MRFYLTYKDHGFYDPVVDDTEVIYIPVDPEELEIVKIQTNIQESQQKFEIIDFNRTGGPSTLVQPVQDFLIDPDIEELPLLINVEEIPPGSKFRLPVSETYDPEGNRVKLDKNKGKAGVIFNVTKIVDETSEERIKLQQQAQDAVSEYISESKINQHQDIKENFIETEKETDLNVIRDKALEVVNESIDRSISVANDINENVNTKIKTSEDLSELTKEFSKSFEEKLENVNIRKESIKNIDYEVNVSEEIKKFEKVTQATESNIEERKSVAKQEIDETIQSGTVRRTSEVFNKENIEISKPYRIETNKDYDPIHTGRDENSYSGSSAKQRAFSIGLQTIPHIRENINPYQIDCRLNLLTTFFLQLTNIMVTLSRFIAVEQKTYLAQGSCTSRPEQRGFEQKKKKTKLDKSNEQIFERFQQHEEGQGLSKYKYEHVSNDSEGEIIRKGKLSGAKIAQIEGRKTTELTDKMDIVISEFHNKTGSEEESHDQFYGSHSGSRSKMKSEKNTFYGDSQKQSQTDQRKIYEEFSEIKTQSLDIHEMKSENHSFESKTVKTEEKPYANETTSTDGQNLTYVAIVEAHVYTNKEAIFEEQMKREKEMKSKNIEETKIETNQDIGMLSLADTITIPQTEVITVNEIKDKVNKIERGVSSIEESTIKIAAKKISEVLEPLIELTSGRSYSVKQTDTVEELHITGLSKKIYPSLEKPTKAVVQITEITAEEKESQDLDVLKLIVAKPKSLIEDAKPIAETIEISIKEDELTVLDESKPHLQKSRQLVESMVKSVAETTEIVTGSLPEESKSERETKEKYPATSVEDPHLRIAQVFTILPDEPKDEHLEVSKIKECKSSIDIVEIKAAETIIIRPEEPNCEQLEVLKIVEKFPETTFEGPSLKVAEIISVLPEEPKHEFYVPELKSQQAGIKIIEFKAAESTIVEAEESKQQELKIEQPQEKRSKQIIEPSSLSVAIQTKEIVKSNEIGRSISPTSPLSPTTPAVEEYVFSLEAELEHPYVVEEAVSEEASIKIKTQKKNIQSADTRFTLAIEKIVEANSGTIEEIEEIENIHLSKEVHQSMYEGYEAKKSNISANIEVKSLDENQGMSTETHSLDAHHNLTVKNQTLMQDAISIASLETNQKVNKSRKQTSSESQYSAGQEIQSSVKSIQSGSSRASIKAISSQYAEASNKLLPISESKSMESTVMEGNIGLERHQHLRTASGTYKEAASKSVESKSFGTIESVSQLSTQLVKGESNASLLNEKLTLRTDLKSSISNDGESSSPLSVPPTPVTDEYVFRLQAELPEESTFIPRDCSISPESAHEDVVVKGLLTNYKTKIEDRILYSPPLPTPPTTPEKAKPVYTKPGLKGGSERQELTKEEIHDSTLVSAIDRTLKQIEEYKASVGLTTEEMSYHQEDGDKEFTPIQIVEEWLDNEANHDTTQNIEVEEVDAVKITIVAEDNKAGETAVTVTTERHVEDDGDDLEIQEISRNFDEISLEIEHGRVLNEQRSSENKVDEVKHVQINPDPLVHEDDYEWVAVHPSSINRIGADDESLTTKVVSEVLITDINAQEVQTTDKSQELVMRHDQDQEIIGDEAIIPPVDSLKNSEVIKLLNEERTGVEERKWTTFLQKKYSPTPKTEVVYYGDFDIKTQIIPDAYKVKIVRQPKPKIAPDWKDETLKKESSPVIEISEPQVTVVTEIEENDIIEEDINISEEEDNIIEQEQNIEEDSDTEVIPEVIDKETEELDLEEMAQRNLAEELIKNVENMIDVNAPTDQQLEQMRDQLAALAQLPSVIQRTVELVNKRINLISQKSEGEGTDEMEQQKKDEEEEHRRQEEEHRRQEEEYRRQEEEKHAELERAKHSLELRVQKTEEELAILMKEQGKRRIIAAEKQKKEKVELMKIDQKSRQVTQRSTPRVGKPMSLFGPLQERPVILPGGKKWRTPEDVYDEEFITESLVGQAEVIKGTAIGVNFMKFDKPPPALDHLKHSEVFKAIHNIEEPVKKVELLGPVLSDADYREKARSMSPCVEKVAEFSGTKQVQREVEDLS